MVNIIIKKRNVRQRKYMAIRHWKGNKVRECLVCYVAYIDDYVNDGLCPDCIIKMITKDSPYPKLSKLILNEKIFPKRRKDDF